jgi:hypothetical protein
VLAGNIKMNIFKYNFKDKSFLHRYLCMYVDLIGITY